MQETGGMVTLVTALSLAVLVARPLAGRAMGVWARRLAAAVVVLALVAVPRGVEAQLSWEITPVPPQDPKSNEMTSIGYVARGSKRSTVSEAERRVNRNRISLGVSAVPTALGTIIATAGALGSLSQTGTNPDTSSQDGALYLGSVMAGAGAVWMITSGIVLGVRKRQLRQAQGTSKKELRLSQREARESAEPSSVSEPVRSAPTRPYDKRLAR